MSVKIICGDSLIELAKLPENSVESICCDPPYGLKFMGKKWDYDVPSVELWEQILRVLKPGGHLLSFAGSRTYHRMAVNIEDAGFDIRDQIMWVMGSGFPKSHNIWKALKKECKCGIMEQYGEETEQKTKHYLRPLREADIQATESITEEQRKALLEGLQEQGLPFEDTPEGMLFISERRGESSMEGRCNIFQKEGELYRCAICKVSAGVFTDGKKGWVYNGTPTCCGESSRQNVDEKGGSTSQGPQSEQQLTREPCSFCKQFGPQTLRTFGTGTAVKPAHEPIVVARKPLSESTIAKNVLKWGTGGINIDGCRVGSDGGTKLSRVTKKGDGIYEGNVNTGEFGKTVEGLGRFPANLIHDGSDEATAGMGDKARYFYCSKASKKDRNEGNNHPTVKPTKLMQYLVRLVTPKGGTVLDPFMGSGSTGKACILEGFDFIGIELDEEYCKIAQARIDAVKVIPTLI